MDKPKVISDTRSRRNRVYYFLAAPEAKSGKRGRRRVYRQKMDLKDPATWPKPDDVATLHRTTYRGKAQNVVSQSLA